MTEAKKVEYELLGLRLDELMFVEIPAASRTGDWRAATDLTEEHLRNISRLRELERS